MSARDDYPHHGFVTHAQMCDEIDRLRLSLAWTERIAEDRGEENERLRERFMSVDQAAAYLGVTSRTVDRWISNSGLPVHRLGADPRPRSASTAPSSTPGSEIDAPIAPHVTAVADHDRRGSSDEHVENVPTESNRAHPSSAPTGTAPGD